MLLHTAYTFTKLTVGIFNHVLVYFCAKVFSMWALASKVVNKMAHALNGDDDNGTRYNMTERAIIFVVVKEEFAHAPYGYITRTLERLRGHNVEASIATIRRAQEKYATNGWQFDGKDGHRSGRKRKLSATGVTELVAAVTGSQIRAVAKTQRFSSPSGEQVTVGRATITRHAVQNHLVKSVPKVIRIRPHTDHHRRMRCISANWLLLLSDEELDGIWWADEMSWPIRLTANRQNDVIWVPQGQQSSTNIVRATKGDTRQMFSLFWCVNSDGPLCFKLYAGMMDTDFFHELLLDEVQPVVRKLRRTSSRLRLFWHDHVTNSQRFQDPTAMNTALGAGKWLHFAPPICREENGVIHVAAVPGKRRAYDRKRMSPKKHCDCEVKSGAFVASSSPDMNMVEYANGLLRANVYAVCNSGGKTWTSSVVNNMQIVTDEIKKLAADKPYWRNLINSARRRAREIVDVDGNVYL